MDLWSMRDNSFRQAHFWHVFDPFDRNGRPKPTWNLGKKLTWLGWPRRILTMKWGGFLWNICHQDCTLHLQVGKFRSEKMETQAQKNDKLKSRCFKFMYYGGSMGEASTALNWKPSWACAGAIRGKAVKTPALKRMDFGGFWCPRIQVSLMQQLDEQRKLDCDRLALAVASVASVAEMLRHVAKSWKAGPPGPGSTEETEEKLEAARYRRYRNFSISGRVYALLWKLWTQLTSQALDTACADKYNFLERAFGEQARRFQGYFFEMISRHAQVLSTLSFLFAKSVKSVKRRFLLTTNLPTRRLWRTNRD